MFRRIDCLLILVLFTVISTAQPLHALTRQYITQANDAATSKLINDVLGAQITEATPVASADLQIYSIYDAFILALEIMQKSPTIEEVECPVLAPDQSMVFIPYFPKGQSENMRFITLYRRQRQRNIAIYNADEASFNEFTAERYKMHFHHVQTKKTAQ